MWGQRSCRKRHEGVELEFSEGEALKEEITHEKAPGQEESITFEKPREGPTALGYRGYGQEKWGWGWSDGQG